MIKQVYSRRLKKNVYRLDTRLSHGIRFRRFFLKRSDAEAVAYKIKHDATTRRFGLSVALDRPLVSELAARYSDDMQNSRERQRAKRVLADFCKLLTTGLCVDEVTKADCKRYIDKRMRDELKPQSIDRELNIIVAMFNQAENYFPALDQWRPPRIPRPKIIVGRRERTWSEHEIKVVLGELFAPKREDENVQCAIARYQVGCKVQFCLLNGVRHSEMNLIPKTGLIGKLGKCESDRARPATTKSSVRSDQLRWQFFASLTTHRKRIWCSHIAAISHQSFTGFFVRLVNAQAFHTAVVRAMA
jgi:hypothetical protein